MQFRKIIGPLILLLLSFSVRGASAISRGHFRGRVTKINKKAEFLRIKIDFTNQKYLNKGDQLEFWNQSQSGRRCLGHILGRSNHYLLLKIPNFITCMRSVGVTPGIYLHFFSNDFKENLIMGKDLLKILLKKRLAIHGRWERLKKELNIHVEKVNTVNKRFYLLKAKLETQWGGEIASLEEDRSTIFSDFKNYEVLLNDIDRKLEKYRIEDSNLKVDRWALDPKLYYRK